MSQPREELPIEWQDCSNVGTPSVQRVPQIRPRLEVAAELRTPGWGVRGLVEDSTAGCVWRVCRPLHANAMHGCAIMTDVEARRGGVVKGGGQRVVTPPRG